MSTDEAKELLHKTVREHILGSFDATVDESEDVAEAIVNELEEAEFFDSLDEDMDD